MRGEMLKVSVVTFILLCTCSCMSAVKKPVKPVFDYASKADIDNLQGEIFVQMDAFIEEVREQNQKMIARVKHTVESCLCPSEMK